MLEAKRRGASEVRFEDPFCRAAFLKSRRMLRAHLLGLSQRATFLPSSPLSSTLILSTTALSDHIKMSQCPLGFKGTPPPGHPKVAGLDTSSSGSKAAAGNLKHIG